MTLELARCTNSWSTLNLKCNANTFVKVDTQVEGKLPTDYLSLILLIMLNAGRDEGTSIKVTVYLPFSFEEKISTKQDIASTEISYQFLAPKVSVLRRNKATNSSTSTDPFSAATKTLVLGNLFKFERFAITFARAFCHWG